MEWKLKNVHKTEWSPTVGWVTDVGERFPDLRIWGVGDLMRWVMVPGPSSSDPVQVSGDCGCYRPAVTVSSWWIIGRDWLSTGGKQQALHHQPFSTDRLCSFWLTPQFSQLRNCHFSRCCCLNGHASPPWVWDCHLALSIYHRRADNYYQHHQAVIFSFFITCIKIPGQPQWLREECPGVFRHDLVTSDCLPSPHLVPGGSRGLATHRWWRPCPGHNNSDWSEFSQSGR